jgi:hypothetical protein
VCTFQFFLHCSHLFFYINGWWWWHSNDCFKQCYDFSQLLELVGTYRFVKKIIFSGESRGGGGGKPFKLGDSSLDSKLFHSWSQS